MKLLYRNYSMSDPALKYKCDDVLDSMDRDIAEFSLRGYTPAKRTDFENHILAFDALPTDNEMEALKENIKLDYQVVLCLFGEKIILIGQ